MATVVLRAAGLEPGWFIGGVPRDLPSAAALFGRSGPSLASHAKLIDGFTPSRAAPFVIEGDEYDAVYWHKEPKFLDYIGVGDDDVAIVTSVEQDHIDIYPDVASYEHAFRSLLCALPDGGLVVADAHDPRVRALVNEAKCRVVCYGLEGDDTGDVTPTWLGAPAPAEAERRSSRSICTSEA